MRPKGLSVLHLSDAFHGGNQSKVNGKLHKGSLSFPFTQTQVLIEVTLQVVPEILTVSLGNFFTFRHSDRPQGVTGIQTTEGE